MTDRRDFVTTEGGFSCLSNKATGFPLLVNGLRVPSSEHLFCALRYPDQPGVQEESRRSSFPSRPGHPAGARRDGSRRIPVESSFRPQAALPMKTTFLEFEQPIAELGAKIEELRYVQDDSAVDISEEIARLEAKSQSLTKDLYAKLSPWQIAQVARHPQRPYTLDYTQLIFTDFEEMHGDRAFADDHAIVGGLARFNGQSVMVIGHQKGRDTKEKIFRNFGMPRPEGYRKALRLMRLAEKFGIPVVTFVDTPGAYPGIDAEERGQSEAIGRNLYAMAELKVPIITTVIGEGGSGGALAIAVGDVVMMLQYATYSVISPEGCASILWKSAERAPEAAETMGITAARLKTLGLVDRIVSEPLGGAHRDHRAMAQALKKALQDALRQIADLSTAELVEQRFERMLGYGKYKEQQPAH